MRQIWVQQELKKPGRNIPLFLCWFSFQRDQFAPKRKDFYQTKIKILSKLDTSNHIFAAVFKAIHPLPLTPDSCHYLPVTHDPRSLGCNQTLHLIMIISYGVSFLPSD